MAADPIELRPPRTAAADPTPRWASCPRCFGERVYVYDDNHATICELCCPHDQGFWQLPQDGYGSRGGWWNCRAGCGHTVPDRPESVDPVPGAEPVRLKVGDRVLHRWTPEQLAEQNRRLGR